LREADLPIRGAGVFWVSHVGAGGKPVKARRRKTVTRKRHNAPKAVRRRTSFAGAHQTDLARVIRERDEALEQQRAISDVLRVISNSPSDVQPVLDSVAERAAHICEARVVEITTDRRAAMSMARPGTGLRQFIQKGFDDSNRGSPGDKPMSRNMESSRLSNSRRERKCCHHSPITRSNSPQREEW
jgi:hypothetical protein